MKHFALVAIILTFIFMGKANSQIKIGKPPTGGGSTRGSGGGAIFRDTVNEVVLKYRIDQFLRSVKENARQNNIEFEKFNIVDVANALKMESYLNPDQCSEINPASGGKANIISPIGKLPSKIFDAMSLEQMRQILKDEKLFTRLLTTDYQLSEEQAKEVIEVYKMLCDLSTEK
jgi:hypothetical protein